MHANEDHAQQEHGLPPACLVPPHHPPAHLRQADCLAPPVLEQAAVVLLLDWTNPAPHGSLAVIQLLAPGEAIQLVGAE